MISRVYRGDRILKPEEIVLTVDGRKGVVSNPEGRLG
jgi:hypothetical protein